MEIADVKETAEPKENKWEIEEDCRTLKKAEEIKKDPERMKKCMAMLNNEKSHISSIEDLNKAADDHFATKKKEKMQKEMMEE